MSYVEKYTVSKRGKEEGPYAAAEIIDLLRMKELSTIHKVKVGADWMVVPDFIDLFEKGELPEQNLEKSFEDAEEAAKEEEEAAESEEATQEPEPEPEPEPIEVPEPGPAVEIHVNRSGTQFGPYLFKELKDYLKAGNLRFSDMVWFEGLPEWVQLSSIPGVADGIDSLGSAAPPPPKPPPAPAAPAAPAAPPPVQQATPASAPPPEPVSGQSAESASQPHSTASSTLHALPVPEQQNGRHGCLTAYLIFGLVANSLSLVGQLFAAFAGAKLGFPLWLFPVFIIVNCFNIACMVALFKWQKWAFWGIVASTCLVFPINLKVFGVAVALPGLLGIAFLYGVLQIGKHNKGWPQLK